MSHLDCLFVPSDGQSGGLAMIWTKDTNLNIVTYGLNHIDAIVTKPKLGFKWRIIGFYGHLNAHKRKEFWELLAILNNRLCLPWLRRRLQ